MSLIAALGSLELGLIFSLVALGVLIAFRILNFPDMTADGSFPLGAAVTASLITLGTNPFIATGAAILAGFLFGWLTATLHVKWRIMQLLAGILVMIALYSINLRIMGRSNVPLINDPTVFTLLTFGDLPDYWLKPILLFGIVVLVKILFDAFFATDLGLAMRATGANLKMARAQGVKTDRLTQIGLALSNGLIALAGSLYAQSQGGADVSMGIGTIVIGLAAVIIGETLFPARGLILAALACILGAILYRFFIALALNGDFIGLQAQDLNLVTAVLVVFALLIPHHRAKLSRWLERKKV